MSAAASPGLEQLAEDGMFSIVSGERLAVSPDSQGTVVTGSAGPIQSQEVTSSIVTVGGDINTYVSFGAMILPSNDAFIGTDEAIRLFDADGDFEGAQTIVFEGEDVYDAGTEVNTEEDAAFLNQTGPNTGVDENGVIRQHPGFNGSEGNPTGEGDQNIIGGTNAFGAEITEAADFTRDGAQVAVVHINEVIETVLGGGNDRFRGGEEDDIVHAGGGRDRVDGGRGNDQVFGGAGDDRVDGGRGDDLVSGGAGDDDLRGNRGEDTFVFADGYGDDQIRDFGRGDDTILLNVTGIESFEDVLGVATESHRGVELDFGDGDGDSLFLRRVDIEDLSADDFLIV